LRLIANPIRTKYWHPGDDFVGTISNSVSGLCQDRDFVVISEKAISVSLGLLALVIGRAFRWTARATPLTVAGLPLTVEDALVVADAVDQARGFGAAEQSGIWLGDSMSLLLK